MSFKLLIAPLILIVALAAIFAFKSNVPTAVIQNFNAQTQAIMSPTPDPFEELTIPYLRNRDYKSTLGDLEKVSDNGNYTSYLTSYDSDGLKVNGLLTVPDNSPTNNPAIIFIHGYIPPRQYQTLTRYIDHVDFLARNGFVVFKIDLRGHGDSEGQPGGGYYSSDYIIDVLNARAALQNSDLVNKHKIGLWGHSMAGNVVLRTLAARPEIPAAVIWAGAGYTYLDLREYGIDDNSYQPPPSDADRQRRRRELFEKHGTPSAESKFWQEVAATSYLNDLKGAIEIHHAIDDPVVSIEYTRNLKSLLDKTSVPHEIYEYPSGGHNIIGGSFTTAMQRSVEFFSKYLK